MKMKKKKSNHSERKFQSKFEFKFNTLQSIQSVMEFNKKNELKLNEYFPYYVDHSLDFEKLIENSKIISKLILLGGERKKN
jgi:hypothetical protein